MKPSHLPRLYQITPEPAQPPHFDKFLEQLIATLQSGIELVQLRAKHLDRQDHLHVARLALAQCRQHGARLMFNGSLEIALEIGCDGVHLNSHTLMSLKDLCVPEGMLVSAACHSSDQLAQASRIGVDFVTLSPVLQTQTHPEAEPLGWEHFSQLVSGAQIPVFALGGMTPALIDNAQRAGAWGIAAISATWRGSGCGSEK